MLPEGIKYIDERAFDGCSGLKEIKLPDSLEIISTCAFRDCTALLGIYIPSVVKEIMLDVTQGCTDMVSIKVSEVNTVYRAEAECLINKSDNVLIAGCKASVIPASVNKIGYRAFEYCTTLEKLLFRKILK